MRNKVLAGLITAFIVAFFYVVSTSVPVAKAVVLTMVSISILGIIYAVYRAVLYVLDDIYKKYP